MKSGRTFWDELCHKYDDGVQETRRFLRIWDAMQPYVDSQRFEEVQHKLRIQTRDSEWWRDACLLYFQTFSHRPLPPDSPAFHYTLEQVQRYHLNMDNYTAADPAKLP